MQKRLHTQLPKLLLLLALLFGINSFGQTVNIIPVRSTPATVPNWIDVNIDGSAYIQLLKANSSTTTPQMNFNQYTNETLNFTARTFGGSTPAADIILTVSVSIDGGPFNVISTRTPSSNNLSSQQPFDLSGINSSNVRIKFSVAGTSDTVGVGLSAISITGVEAAVATPNFAVTGTTSFGTACLNTTSVQQYTITNSGTAATGVTVVSDNSQFVVSGLSTSSIAAGGTATYTVTFTPSSTGTKTATITTTSSTAGSNTVTSSLTGIGAGATAQAVTTATATAINNTTAVLNGNLTTVGTCPDTVEKGFVYALTSVNADPLVAGSGVTKASVAIINTGSYTLSPSLSSGTGYSYKAYAYNGTTYTYGAVQTFTTLPAITTAVNATVDAPFAITFTDNASWRTGITTITVNGNTLAVSAYDKTLEGEIRFLPSASTLLQSSGSKTIVITSPGYGSVTINQVIGAGAATRLAINIQPTAPTVNGAALSTQPVIGVRDQYGNAVSTSSAAISATNNGATTWTLGGNTTVNSVNGVATFTGLTATSAELVAGATITFASSGLISVTSTSFNIPAPAAPAPANDLCANAAVLTVNATPSAGTLNGSTYTTYTGGNSRKDVWYTFTASCTGNYTISVNGFAGDVDVALFNTACPTNNASNIGLGDSSSPTELLTVSLTSGSTYRVRVYAESTASNSTPFNIRVISVSDAPVVATSSVSPSSYNNATINATASITGCSSAITAYGIEYSGTNNFANGEGTMVTGINLNGINYSVEVPNLDASTVYYFKAYATNATGTSYSAQASFTTPVYTVPAPVAVAATNVNTNSFIANWLPAANAISYRLDVATTPDFLYTALSEDFSGFTADRATGSPITGPNIDTYFQTNGWTGSNVYNSIGNPGMARIGAGGSAGYLVSPTINLSGNSGNATLSIDLAKYNTDSTRIKISHAANGTTFVPLANDITILSNTLTTRTFNIVGGTANSKIRIENIAGDQRFYVDNIKVSYNTVLPEYNDVTVDGISKVVTGLSVDTYYYYRVRAIEVTGTPTNSNTITVKTGAIKTWTNNGWSPAGAPTIIDDAIIDAAYDTQANGSFSAANLTVNPSRTFNIATGTTVSVLNNVINNSIASSFTVQNNGALVQTNDVDNTGTINVKKNSNSLYRLDYTMWSSPVSGVQTLTQFSPLTLTNRFYEYGIDNGAEHYISIANTSELFTPAKGYLIRMPDNAPSATVDNAAYRAGTTPLTFTGTFIGTPNNGEVTIPASTQLKRFTAVGNPYPSPISVTEFFSANSNVIDQGSAIYFWRKRNGANTSAYATLTLAGQTAGYRANRNDVSADQGIFYAGAQNTWLISQGQGFIVKTSATAAAGANITFNNSMRRPAPVTGNQAFFRTAQSSTSRLWLNLTSTTEDFTQMAIAYIDGATTGLDYGYDGKMFGDSNTISLYTIAEDTKLAIQARPVFNASDIVPVGYKSAAAGQFTIELDHTDGVFTQGQNIYLKDNVLNIYHDLSEGDYSFATEAGTFNDRFEVVYTSEALGTTTPQLNANSVIIYKKDNTLSVNAGTAVINSVTVFDIRGRKLASVTGVNATATVVAGLEVANEILIIEVNTAQGRISKKIVY